MKYSVLVWLPLPTPVVDDDGRIEGISAEVEFYSFEVAKDVYNQLCELYPSLNVTLIEELQNPRKVLLDSSKL